MIKLNVYCSCFYPDGEIMTSFGEKITGGAGMKNNIFILDQINFPELATEVSLPQKETNF